MNATVINCWQVSEKPKGTATPSVGDTIDSQQDTRNILLYCTPHEGII